jgi:hypothetical protein
MDDNKFNDKKFIVTTSENTACLLLQTGHQLINKTDSQWFFLNGTGELVFSELDKAVFTDKIYI